MRSYCFEIVFVICLPIQVLNIRLKFEGLIDLGPKWDYVYKLSPITKYTINSKETTLNESSNNRNGKEDRKKDLDTDDLKTDSQELLTSINIPKVYKGSLRNELSLEIQHEVIDKELNIDKKVLESSSKKDIINKKHRKTTKTLDLRNTYMFFASTNSNSQEKNDDKYDRENNFKIKNDKSDFEDVNVYKHKLDYDKQRKKHTPSLLRDNKLDKYKLKNNAKIKEFIVHIFKQSLKVFDKMKKLTDDERIKRKFKLLKNGYIEKFGDFLKETEDHKLKTKLADQHVVLNTIDTSHNILKRLVNHLSAIIHQEFNLQTNSGLIKLFEREVETGKYIEDKHACKKLAICRTNNEFSDFIIDVLTIILRTSDAKLTQASNSLTEIIKTNDLTNIIDYETQSKLRKLMTNMENWDPLMTRSMFLIFRNVIRHKNQPITIMEKADINLANRTVSFYNLIDILNKNIGTVENKSEWKVIKRNLEDWKDGERSDVQTVLETIIRQIINELEVLDYEKRKDVSDLMKILVNSRV